MRKLFLITIIFFASLGFAFSQGFSSPPCVITLNDTGYYTPYYDSLPCIEQGLPYSSSMQVGMPAVFNSSILLDSLVITSITGLPQGIAYVQNPPSGVYYGGSGGCIAFAGTTSNDTGSYPLGFTGYAVISTQSSGTQIFSFSQLAEIQDAPVPVYQLHVISPGDSCFSEPAGFYYTLGISNLLASSQLNVYPNPSSGVFNLELTTDKSITGQIIVTDITGKTVYRQPLNTSGLYKNTISLNNCARGLYLLQIKTAEGLVSKSISLQ